jgi:CubicO group peptidase (beta-lactamase class C family)
MKQIEHPEWISSIHQTSLDPRTRGNRGKTVRNRPSFKDYLWKISILCILISTLVVPPASAMEPGSAWLSDFSKIDNYISSQMKTFHIPGTSIAIVRDDEIVHTRGFGIADPSGRLMTPQTPMLIGSVTKSFTALAIMQLVEAGRVDLDTSVQTYLPWFQVMPPPGMPNTDKAGAPDLQASSQITIRHLLNQTSGLTRAAGEKMLADGDTSDAALERQVRALRTEHLSTPAGIRFEYSNANYIILGMIVQVESGQPYEAYIQEHIFTPLEMENSFTSQADARQHGLSAGYRQWFGFPVVANDLPYPREMVPAGYLISSAEDLGHYLIAQLNQGRYGSASILSPEGIETLHAPAVAAAPQGYHRQPSGSYAMGWYSMEMNDTHVLVHDGDTPTFHADVILIPSGKWGIVLLVNTNTVLLGDGIRNLGNGIAALLNGQQPTAAPTNYPSIFLYGSMIGFLAFELFDLARLIGTWRRPLKMEKKFSGFKLIGLPLLIGGSVAVWMFVMMPLMFQVGWKVMLLNQPDLSWVILLGGSLALFNGVLRTGRNAWRIIKFVVPPEKTTRPEFGG